MNIFRRLTRTGRPAPTPRCDADLWDEFESTPAWDDFDTRYPAIRPWLERAANDGAAS